MYIMYILYISCTYYIYHAYYVYHVHTIHIMHHVPKAASHDYIDWAGQVQNMDSGLDWTDYRLCAWTWAGQAGKGVLGLTLVLTTSRSRHAHGLQLAMSLRQNYFVWDTSI